MRVVIAEDLFLLREGLTRMLEARGFEVTAAVDNPADFTAALAARRPDVAVVDVQLPPTFTDEGLRAALQARRDHPGLPVLVLSQYVEQLYARELLADGSGGVGYLLKDRVLDGRQFTDALQRVAGGSGCRATWLATPDGYQARTAHRPLVTHGPATGGRVSG